MPFSLQLVRFVRYLQKDKINGPEGNTVVYELAERALDGEVSQKIKEYISQVHSISSFDLLVKHPLIPLLYHYNLQYLLS